MHRILTLTSHAITKITLLQAITILANNCCESSSIVPNIFYSFTTVVGYAHTPTHSTLSPHTTIGSHSQKVHHPRDQLKKGLDLQMHLQL